MKHIFFVETNCAQIWAKKNFFFCDVAIVWNSASIDNRLSTSIRFSGCYQSVAQTRLNSTIDDKITIGVLLDCHSNGIKKWQWDSRRTQKWKRYDHHVRCLTIYIQSKQKQITSVHTQHTCIYDFDDWNNDVKYIKNNLSNAAMWRTASKLSERENAIERYKKGKKCGDKVWGNMTDLVALKYV